MPARLPSDLLKRPAAEAARLLVLGYLDGVDKVTARLLDPSDTEALHDFRVGLRRLRSSIRAYRSHLKGSVSKRLRQRLRNLTAATNAARDIEVQLLWLHQQAAGLGAGELEGLAWLIGRLEGRSFEALEGSTLDVARRYSRAASKLRPRLRTFRIEVRPGAGPGLQSFAQAAGSLVRSHAAALKETLQDVDGPENVRQAHGIRIAAKRLRYLLEPLVRRAPRAKSLIGRLKELQDLLGDLHDIQILSEDIASSVELLSQSSPERTPGAIPGLLALQQRVHLHAGHLYARFRSRWAEAPADQFLGRVTEFARTLERADAGPAEIRHPPTRIRREEVGTSVGIFSAENGVGSGRTGG